MTIGIKIRIALTITMRITVGFTMTISISIQITTLKRTVTSGLTVIGKQGRQTHGRTHNMFFAHTTV
jgi:hypothetical protein